MALSLSTTDRIRAVESIIQMTLPAGETLKAGDMVKINTTTGKFEKANATTAAEGRAYGVALGSVYADNPVTALRKGVVAGFDLGTTTFDQAIYLDNGDGSIGTAAGSVSIVVGRVVPATSELLGSAYAKLLFIDL